MVAGAALGLSLGLTGGSPATGLVVTSEVVKATTGTIKQTVATLGTLEPASQANLDFGVSGVVTAVDVKAGQVVTVGQVVGHGGYDGFCQGRGGIQRKRSCRVRPSPLSSDERGERGDERTTGRSLGDVGRGLALPRSDPLG